MKQLQFVGEKAAAVTPNDTAVFTPSLIYVGTAGTITIRDVAGVATQFTTAVGTTLPVLAIGVNSTGTAATLIVRCF